MADPTPTPAPAAAPVVTTQTVGDPKQPTDWPTLAGVVAIAGISVAALYWSPATAHDIALAGISGLTGWMGHKVLTGVAGGGQ